MFENEVTAHEHIWIDLRRTTEQYLNRGAANDASLAETRDVIKRQLTGLEGAWSHLKGVMDDRQRALNDCLESAQFYADADEASQWIKEKTNLVDSSGILTQALNTQSELEKALAMCGSDSSATAVSRYAVMIMEKNDVLSLLFDFFTGPEEETHSFGG